MYKGQFLKVRTALSITVVGIVTFVGGLFLGAFFGFPYPDASIEESASIQLYNNIAFLVILISGITTIVGFILLLKVLLGSLLHVVDDSPL